jgi:Ca2+-dependent lipid-binding protein
VDLYYLESLRSKGRMKIIKKKDKFKISQKFHDFLITIHITIELKQLYKEHTLSSTYFIIKFHSTRFSRLVFYFLFVILIIFLRGIIYINSCNSYKNNIFLFYIIILAMMIIYHHVVIQYPSIDRPPTFYYAKI